MNVKTVCKGVGLFNLVSMLLSSQLILAGLLMPAVSRHTSLAALGAVAYNSDTLPHTTCSYYIL